MKNVLFATTALVAFAGAASAASHGGMAPAVSFSGEMTAGYNDGDVVPANRGMFYDANLDMSVTVDMGDSVTATLTAGIATGDERTPGGTLAFNPTIEIAYTGPVNASLRMGDMNDKGASEYFYADRSGMALDVENQDNATDVRTLVEFGSYGAAVGCQLANTNSCQGLNAGAGATFGTIKIGVGYDTAGNAAGARTGVSVDASVASFDVGVSYITDNTDNSIGLELGRTFGAIKVGAYYASNSAPASSNAYGVSADYSTGALSLGAYYDSAATNSYGLNVGYAVSDAIQVSAGVKVDAVTDYYVGMEYTVNSNISATVSYATADAISGPEFKNGITALITASF